MVRENGSYTQGPPPFPHPSAPRPSQSLRQGSGYVPTLQTGGTETPVPKRARSQSPGTRPSASPLGPAFPRSPAHGSASHQPRLPPGAASPKTGRSWTLARGCQNSKGLREEGLG